MNPLALEIITLYRGTVLDVCHLAPGQRFTIGPDTADLPLEHARLTTDTPYPVARVDAQGRARIDPVPGCRTSVLVDGAVHPVDGARGVRLVPGQKARVELGDTALLFALVHRAAELPRAPIGLVDRQGRRYLGLAAGVHAVLLALAFTVPVQAGSMSMDSLDMGSRWVEFEAVPDQQMQQTAQAVEQPEDSGPAEPTAPAPQQWTEPKPEPSGHEGAAVAGTDDAAVKAARKAEAHAAANEIKTALDGLVPDIGAQAHDAIAGLNGDVGGDPLAMGGTGNRLDKFGMPGVWPGDHGGPSVGPGRIATRSGKGDDPYGRVPGGAKIPKKPKTPPKVIPQRPEVSDGLTREEIQRVVRNHRRSILHCYEKALQTKRDLAGKVRMAFFVGPDGRVLGATTKESTLREPEVEACMARSIQQWQFPTVRGGGTVKVTYPFLFRAAD